MNSATPTSTEALLAEGSNKNCYAGMLGPCGTMSRQHVITRAIFGDGLVSSRNLRIQDGKEVSIDSMTAKILCERHNSALGKLDDEITRLSSAIVAWRADDAPRTVVLNGFLIERWLLKTLLELFLSGWLGFKQPIPFGGTQAIYGLKRLKGLDSLYMLGDVPIEAHDREVTFAFLREGERQDCGAIFMTIHGVALLFSNNMTDPQTTLRAQGRLMDYDVSSAMLRRHAPTVMVTGAKHKSQLRLTFDWSNRLRPPF